MEHPAVKEVNLQLPREIVVEKSGEFRGIRHQEKVSDNPEPSPENASGKVQRLSREGVLFVSDGEEAPDTLTSIRRKGDEIVQALK